MGPDERCGYLVLGCHRTGTSAITRVLRVLGLYVGEDEHLLRAIEHDNPRGFYEHKALMRVSDELLERLGGTWRDPPSLGAGWEVAGGLDDLRDRGRELIARELAGRAPWGFKDPRLSLTLPFWRTVMTPAGHVIAHRSPLDVARSLERRNGIALSDGVALWAHYTASALVNTAGEPRFIVGYEELFTAGQPVAAELAAFLGLPDPLGDAQRRSSAQEAVDRTLRHHAGAPAELVAHPAVSSEARRLFEALQRATAAHDVPRGGSEELDGLAEEILESGAPRPRASGPAARPARPAAPPKRLGPRPLRVVAMLQVYNEQRFLARCLEHLSEQGVGVYVIDNESSDDTLEIAERHLGHGVIGIETLPREDCFALRVQCRRQEELAESLDADWLIHHDADEIRVSPTRGQTLAEAIAEFDAAGFNAVNFLEFAFVPTREFPDHDHPGFAQTMRWYYPFGPRFPHRLNAWKRQDGPIDLVTEAGHLVSFPGLRMAPSSLYMRHYLFLSRQHALEKFVHRRFAEDEVRDGWFGWRARLRPEMVTLPSVTALRPYIADHRLDPAEPRQRHLLEESLLQSLAVATA